MSGASFYCGLRNLRSALRSGLKSLLEEHIRNAILCQVYLLMITMTLYMISSIILCAANRPDTIAVGIPVPGRVLAPTK